MSYIIENTVMFDEIKGCLLNFKTNDEISLPPTAVCILLILLSSGSSPVERNVFIEQVYTRFGFDLSNNTLNQYISLLRKNIRYLGIEADVIMTVPRVGFYISADINVVKKPTVIVKLNDQKINPGKGKCNLLAISVIIMVLVIIGEVIFLTLPNDMEPEEYPLVKAGRIGECDLYFPVNLAELHLKDYEEKAASLAERYLPCTPGSVFIYDINAMNFLNGSGKVYLSRCTGEPGGDTFAVCAEVGLNE